MTITLSLIADHLQAQTEGDPELKLVRIASLDSARAGDISFLSHARYANRIKDFQGSALILHTEHRSLAPAGVALLLVSDPYLAYARLTQLWRKQHPLVDEPRLHPSAVIHPSAWLDEDVVVGPQCVIAAGARIGSGSRLVSQVHVGVDVQVGCNALLHPGVVLGADGFGFAPHRQQWEKIEQLGQVILGHDVELGANTCVDRAALGATILEDGVKLDNLVQIGHNVRVGAHTAMAGCVGIAGSAHIGAHCTLGGGAIVLGHLQLADHVHISAASVVTRSIFKPGTYTGFFPLDDNNAWEKNAASLKQLSHFRARLKNLEHMMKKESL